MRLTSTRAEGAAGLASGGSAEQGQRGGDQESQHHARAETAGQPGQWFSWYRSRTGHRRQAPRPAAVRAQTCRPGRHGAAGARPAASAGAAPAGGAGAPRGCDPPLSSPGPRWSRAAPGAGGSAQSRDVGQERGHWLRVVCKDTVLLVTAKS